MDGLWEIIHKTIEEDPQSRPTFRELREAFLKQPKEMTEDDYLLDVIDNLNDHLIKIELIENLKLQNTYKRLTSLYIQMKNHNMAIKCGEKCLKICSELEKESSLDVAYLYYMLANLYIPINNGEEVISYLDKVLNILLKMPKEDNRLLKIVYNIRGLFYTHSGDYKKGKEQYDEAFKIESEEYYTEVNLYYRIIETFTYMNNYEKVAEICDKVLKEIQKVKNVQSMYAAKLYIILGLTYLFKGNFEAGKKALNEALNKMLSEYEKQDLFFIVHLLLGISDTFIGNFDQAIKAFDKSLSISLEIDGGMDIYTLYLYTAKACAYLDKGDYKRSIELYNKSLNISLHMVGLQHKLTLLIYLSLGTLYCNIGDFIKAKSNYLKALDIAIKIFKRENTLHGLIYSNL